VSTLREGLVGRLAIAIVGPEDLVERAMLASSREAAGDWHLVAAAYREEHETVDLLARLEGRVDACLFTGPLPYDIALASGALTTPATFVPLNDAALYRTLLRGVVEGACDPRTVSIDTLTLEDVEEAYAEIGVSLDRVRVHEYGGPEPSAAIAAFHEDLWRAGSISTAVTCIRSVWTRLQSAGVPVLRVLPTQASFRSALRMAALMGVRGHLADSQIAVAIVETPATREASGERPALYWREELRLSLHRLLLQEARSMGATLQPFEDHGFLLVTTVGALAASTNGFQVAPLLDRVREELGVGVHVGVGVGRTAQEAAGSASEALARARRDGSQGFALQHAGEVVVLPGRGGVPSVHEAPPASEGMAVLARLVEAFDGQGDAEDREQNVVDVEGVARVLGITPRSARRTLHMLAGEGLAWPLPPGRSPQRGRPRRRYRLVVERLPGQRGNVS
jgi:GTP cyclohydrolase III